MFRGFLYHVGDGRLEELDEKSLFACVLPSDSEAREPFCSTDKFLWLDVSMPTAAEIEALGRRFKLDSQILEDLRNREGRPKLHDYDDYIYLIFHSLHIERNLEGRLEIESLEIDCLLGPDWVLTVHPRPVRAFDDLAVRWKRRPEWMQRGPGHLLYELMDSVLDGYFPILDRLDEQIDTFEDRLYRAQTYDEQNNPLSGDIFVLKRALLQIRHLAGPTRDVVNILLRRDAEEGGKHFAAFQDLYDHSSRIVENIDTYRDILSGALDAYLAIESNRMNAVMKRLTAFSIILLLPSLIAGIFGMNFGDLPAHHGFWGAVAIMTAIVGGLFIYFKKQNWF